MGYIWRIVNKAGPQEVGAHQEDAEYATKGFRGQQDSRGQAYSYFFFEEAADKAPLTRQAMVVAVNLSGSDLPKESGDSQLSALQPQKLRLFLTLHAFQIWRGF